MEHYKKIRANSSDKIIITSSGESKYGKHSFSYVIDYEKEEIRTSGWHQHSINVYKHREYEIWEEGKVTHINSKIKIK